jgi:L-ascorbate metabolism protein UlaG (beta-lactamase superfamily)
LIVLVVGEAEKSVLNLTFLGHSAFQIEIGDLCIYTDPYLQPPVDISRLPKADLVLYSVGHFDHGALMAKDLYERWNCHFAGPKALMQWMHKRRKIPLSHLHPIGHNETINFKGLEITAVPAHRPLSRLGKTIMTLFSRSRAPGKPVNGYYFAGFYHGGATKYSPVIAQALRGKPVHTALLPIGGKYATASPQEALQIAEELSARRLVPMHWQPLKEQVFFRYQSSDLVKLAKSSGSKVDIKALAIGELLEPEQVV